MPPVDPLGVGSIGTVSIQDEAINPLTARPVGDVRPPKREADAGYIAKVIVWTFSGTVALLVILVYWVVLNYPWVDSPAPGSTTKEAAYRAVELLTKAAAPALKEFGTFLSTVFGSLLACILGYYFGEQKRST
jgi:hypothetical protein